MFLKHHRIILCIFSILAFQSFLLAAEFGKPMAFKSNKLKRNTNPQIDFEITVEEKGDYYLSFAMYGNFDEKYDVLIDDHKMGFLNMKISGLQNTFFQKTRYGLDPETVCLNKGTHIITILGINEHVVPNVLDIKVGETIDETVLSIDKPSFKVSESPESQQMNSSVMSSTDYCTNCLVQDPGSPYYEYSVVENASFSTRTFSTNFYFSGPIRVKMNADPIGGTYPIIFLFKKDDPANHTETSNGGMLIKDITDPGYYRCVVAANGVEGSTTLHTNYYTYSNLNVKSGNWYWFSEKPTNPGPNFFMSADGNYDMSQMYLVDQYGKVRAWNIGGGRDLDTWHYNAHCNWPGAVSAGIVGVLLFNNGYGTCTGDLYAFVKNGNNNTMVSTTQNTSYNCFAWSGGLTSKGANWQPNEDPNYNNPNLLPIEAFKNYYGNVNTSQEDFYRYPGALDYDICETSDPEACIDLWGSELNIVHATVSKNANCQYHGYSWESKANGNGNRYFHPRDGMSQGELMYSFKPRINSSSFFSSQSSENTSNIETLKKNNIVFASTPKMKAMGINHPLSFEESVELGLTVLRNAKFTESENEEIDELVASVSEDITSEYTSKLSAWKKTWKDSSSLYKYNLKRLDKSQEKKNLKNFNKTHKEKVWPLLIKMVRNDEPGKQLILEDALSGIPMGTAIMDEVNGELSVNQFTNDGALIVSNDDDRCIMICKKMLQRM